MTSTSSGFELVTGKGATPTGHTIRFGYVSAEAMVVTTDDAAAITDVGFAIARRYEDDTIDDVGLARTLLASRIVRHNKRFEEFITETIPGAVKRLRTGVAPTWNFPRQGLSSVRLLVESVSERLGAGGAEFHPVVLSIRGTAQGLPGGRRRRLAGEDGLPATGPTSGGPTHNSRPAAEHHQPQQRGGDFRDPAAPWRLGCLSCHDRGMEHAGRGDSDPGVRARDRLPASAQLHGPVPPGGAASLPARLSSSACGTRPRARP